MSHLVSTIFSYCIKEYVWYNKSCFCVYLIYRCSLSVSWDSGPGWLNELGSWITLTTHTSLSPIRRGFTPGFVNHKKGALDSQSQVIKFTSCLPIHVRWFSPGTPASSITKTGRHDIAEILLKLALKHQQINQSINHETRDISSDTYKPLKISFKRLCLMNYVFSNPVTETNHLIYQRSQIPLELRINLKIMSRTILIS